MQIKIRGFGLKGKELELVRTFNYQGSIITQNESFTEEIKTRIYYKKNNFWKD